MESTMVRHYRRLRSLTWERRDDYPMPAHLALYLAKQGRRAQAFDWDEWTPLEGHCGWEYRATRDYDYDAEPYEEPYGFGDFLAMYRASGQSRAVAANYARAAVERCKDDATHTTYVMVAVEVRGPNGEAGHASLHGIDYVETDPLADGYVVEVARELMAEAWHDARSQADEREAEELARQAVVFAY